MNRNGKTNAKKGPDKDYNAYKEFFDRETEAHLIAQWMEFVGMQKPEGVDHYNMLPLIVIPLSKNLNQNLPFVHDAVMGYFFILVFDIPVCLLDPPMRRPVPDVDTWTVQEKTLWLETEIQTFLHKVLQPSYDVAQGIDELDIAHREGFTCHSKGCAAVFLLHSSRVP